jgi:hypothetical protein
MPYREIPQSNTGVEASAGEQVPIGTPGQGVHRAAMTGERPQVRAGFHIQKLDDRICPAASEHTPIWGKGQALDIVGLPVRPERGATLQVPQLDAPIKTAGGEGAFIRAECEGRHRTGMRLPGQVQQLPFLPPHPHFSPPAARSPVLPARAGGHGPDSIEGGSPDGLTQSGSRKRRILHLDALQVGPANGESGEVQAAQVAAQVFKQADNIGLRSRSCPHAAF